MSTSVCNLVAFIIPNSLSVVKAIGRKPDVPVGWDASDFPSLPKPARKQKPSELDTLEAQLVKMALKSKAAAPAPAAAAAPVEGQRETESPEKRIRNLNKRLKEIDALQAKIASGEVKPSPEQLEKVQRRDSVAAEIAELQKSITPSS